MDNKNIRSYIFGLAFLLTAGGTFILFNVAVPILGKISNIVIAVCIICIIIGFCLAIYVDKKYPDEDDW